MILSKKAKALILAVIMLSTIIFSTLLIIVDSNHDCAVEECQICQTIQLCLAKFKSLGKDDKDIAISVYFAVFFVVLCFSLISNSNTSTLVTQKVKLSN